MIGAGTAGEGTPRGAAAREADLRDGKLGGVLVTGDHGFVGRHLVGALAGRAEWVAGMDRAGGASAGGAAGWGGPLDTGVDLHYRVDLTDAGAVHEALAALVASHGPPALVFHLAAQAAVGRSFTDPVSTYTTNVVGTAAVLQAVAESAPRARVLVPGSAHVYRPPAGGGRLSEDSPLDPQTHYGVSKLAQEGLAGVFRKARGLGCYVTRAFNHVGPGQGPGFVLPDFAQRLARLEREGGGVLRVGDLTARRDYLDVRDVVAAYLTVLARGEPGTIYNVASGVAWSVQQLLDLLLAETRADVVVQTDPGLVRPVETPILLGDASRLRALGWEPKRDLRDTVRETLDFWRQRVHEETEGAL